MDRPLACNAPPRVTHYTIRSQRHTQTCVRSMPHGGVVGFRSAPAARACQSHGAAGWLGLLTGCGESAVEGDMEGVQRGLPAQSPAVGPLPVEGRRLTPARAEVSRGSGPSRLQCRWAWAQSRPTGRTRSGLPSATTRRSGQSQRVVRKCMPGHGRGASPGRDLRTD